MYTHLCSCMYYTCIHACMYVRTTEICMHVCMHALKCKMQFTDSLKVIFFLGIFSSPIIPRAAFVRSARLAFWDAWATVRWPWSTILWRGTNTTRCCVCCPLTATAVSHFYRFNFTLEAQFSYRRYHLVPRDRHSPVAVQWVPWHHRSRLNWRTLVQGGVRTCPATTTSTTSSGVTPSCWKKADLPGRWRRLDEEPGRAGCAELRGWPSVQQRDRAVAHSVPVALVGADEWGQVRPRLRLVRDEYPQRRATA